MKVGVGIIGAAGYIGAPYLAEILQSENDAMLVAVCGRRLDKLKTAIGDHGVDLVTDDWRQVVRHSAVNLVVVAVPDALHYEIVMACAEAGKHVVCEKPVGMNVREAWEMWSAYRARRLGHFVPFWTRYLPVFVRARQVVREGMLGEVKAVIYRWHNPRPAAMPFTWRDDASHSSAGSIADVGSHAYDIIKWIVGQEATRVLAHAATITPPKPDQGCINLEEALKWADSRTMDSQSQTRRSNTYDFADIAFMLEGGAVGSLVLSHATYLRKGLAPELELHGTEASLAVDRIASSLTLVRPGTEPQRLATVPRLDGTNRFSQYVFPAIRLRMHGSSTDHPGLEDGWRAQIFTDAAAASANQGGWIDLAQLTSSSK